MSNDLSRDEVVSMADAAKAVMLFSGSMADAAKAVMLFSGSRYPYYIAFDVDALEDYTAKVRAPLVAENAALKQAHEINADTLNAMQVEIDDWKARALKAEQAGDRAVPDAEDYDLIDRYLRNNLDDADYGEYLAALDRLVTPQPAAQEQT